MTSYFPVLVYPVTAKQISLQSLNRTSCVSLYCSDINSYRIYIVRTSEYLMGGIHIQPQVSLLFSVRGNSVKLLLCNCSKLVEWYKILPNMSRGKLKSCEKNFNKRAPRSISLMPNIHYRCLEKRSGGK